MPNYKIKIQYDGTDFHGWQIQKDKKTIQGEISRALTIITGKRVRITGSGRTDAGVHALDQTANFYTTLNIEAHSMLKALNSLLPQTIRIIKSDIVDNSFNARFHCIEKTYMYSIFRGKIITPFLYRYYLHYPYNIDINKMQQAAKNMLGERDFTSFTSKSSANNYVKELKKIEFTEEENILRMFFVGSGFLRYMVRTIVGTLLEVGSGKIQPDEIQNIIEAKDRSLAGPTSPPQGLFLFKAKYPEEYE
jgi:tRNA pseudouridine38-40 synthase